MFLFSMSSISGGRIRPSSKRFSTFWIVRFVLLDDATSRLQPYAAAVRSAWRSFLAEPRAPEPPKRVWRDWVLVFVVAGLAVTEAFLRDDLPWEPLALVTALAFSVVLLFRRANPLGVLAFTFGLVAIADVVAIAADVPPPGLYTMAFLLILPYSLFRWGSGREIAIGMVFIVAVLVLGIVADFTDWTEAIGGVIVMLFPAVLGATMRFRAGSRGRELDQARLREREQIARELHDTVAHHVSAIAIQAQVGRTLAIGDPDAPMRALRVVEEEASRTLAEMRTMVGALRQSEELDLAPQRGVADIERLAPGNGHGPSMSVVRNGDLDEIGPSLESALYRLAQESVTNAIRHSRNATSIRVAISGGEESVLLEVSDDGDPISVNRGPVGYGIVGMEERVKLLGGTIKTGPRAAGGWVVEIELPRRSSR